MGCCESRKSLETKFESSLFTPFENSIGLYKYEYLITSNTLKKYSNLSHLSYFQFVGIFDELELPFKDFFKFYDQFDRNRSRTLTEKKYSYLQIQSLNVLLCSGNTKKKLKFLFGLYDRHSLHILNSVKVEEMLENLLKVALDYIPNYFFLLHPENSDLVKYLKALKIGNNILLEKLAKKILNSHSSVSLKDFQTNVFRYFGKDMLRTSFLRQSAFSLGAKAEQGKIRKANRKNTRESSDEFLDDFSDISSSLVPSLNSKTRRHKKSFSNYYPKVVYHSTEDGFDHDSDDYIPENKSYVDSTANSPQKKYYGYSPSMRVHCFVPNKRQNSQRFFRKSNQGCTFTNFTDSYRGELFEIKSEKEDTRSPTPTLKEGTKKRNSANNFIEFRGEVFSKKVLDNANKRLSLRK